MSDSAMSTHHSESVECRNSWIIAALALGVLAVGFGAPLVVAVGLKPIQLALHSDRSVIALAGALTWVGSGIGGVLMGWIADRIGIRLTTSLGAVMTATGLAVSASGSVGALYVGHFLLIGLLGNGALYAPLLIYVSRWFDRRRGSALALIASGQYLSGIIWPAVLQTSMHRLGWQMTMLWFGAVTAALILPVTLFCFRPAPEPVHRVNQVIAASQRRIFGLPPNLVQSMLCAAVFFCCVPMSLPNSHLVAYCSDLGLAPVRGATMLSVLLSCAFISRQFWGWVGDRIGGLHAVICGSAAQALATAGFLLTQSEAGLFAVAAAFGLGFSGIVPSYILAIRELYPSNEASWRVPLMLLFGMSGMAFGSWFAGALYDHFGAYAPAFGAGLAFNLANLAVLGSLVFRNIMNRTSVAAPV